LSIYLAWISFRLDDESTSHQQLPRGNHTEQAASRWAAVLQNIIIDELALFLTRVIMNSRCQFPARFLCSACFLDRQVGMIVSLPDLCFSKPSLCS
jgi:hypothetical protein